MLRKEGKEGNEVTQMQLPRTRTRQKRTENRRNALKGNKKSRAHFN
jgi:hypothetical protein